MFNFCPSEGEAFSLSGPMLKLYRFLSQIRQKIICDQVKKCSTEGLNLTHDGKKYVNG